jgi:hypothetical protein
MKTLDLSDCDCILDTIPLYLSKSLAFEDTNRLEGHLRQCKFCAAQCATQEQVMGLLAEAYNDKELNSKKR